MPSLRISAVGYSHRPVRPEFEGDEACDSVGFTIHQQITVITIAMHLILYKKVNMFTSQSDHTRSTCYLSQHEFALLYHKKELNLLALLSQ